MITTLVATDLVAFGEQCPTADIQLEVRANAYARLREALDVSGVPWSQVYREDRGDGAFIIVPPEVAPDFPLEPLFHNLSSILHRHNRRADDATRLRMRLAVHHGVIYYDAYGVISPDALLLFRLLDARSFRRIIKGSGAHFGAIVSSSLFADAVGRGATTSAGYRKMRINCKDARGVKAWLWLPPKGGQGSGVAAV